MYLDRIYILALQTLRLSHSQVFRKPYIVFKQKKVKKKNNVEICFW